MSKDVASLKDTSEVGSNEDSLIASRLSFINNESSIII
jgi:hypothetical protein